MMRFTVPVLTIVTACSMAMRSGDAATIVVDTLPANNQANLTLEAGQTFTTGSLGGDITLASIEIEGPRTTVPGESLTFALALHVDTDQNHSTWDPGTLLGTSQVDTVVAGGGILTIFNFSGVTLDDNTVYAFKYVDAGGNAIGARMGLTNATAISDGSLFSAGGLVFNDAFDTAMRITTVPEPAAVLLLGTGLAGVVALRRRCG